jgi:YVTN family beta-propeller protein
MRGSRGTRAATAVVPIVLSLVVAVSACRRSPEPARQATAPADGTRIYVSDETGGSIIAIDPDGGRVVDRIAVGKRPRGLRLSRDGTQLLVALSGSPIGGPGVDESKLPPADRAADGIGVVDLATRKLVRTLRSGQDPESFDLSPDGKTLYVSNEDAAEMSVVDVSTGAVRERVKVGGEPEGVTVRPDGRVVYVACEAENEIVAIDAATFAVLAHVKTGPRPRAIAFTHDGATAFVTNENGAAVTVIDAAKHTAAGTIDIPKPDGAPIPPRPMGAVLSPDGTQMFVSLGRAKSVAVLDVPKRQVVRTIEEVGARPWGIAVSVNGRKLYTANGSSGDVSVVDVASGKVDKRIATGGSPWGVVAGR